MARWMTPTPEQEAGLAKWIAERPPKVKAILERLDFYELFRMKSTGHRVILHSVSEDGTVTVHVTARFNLVLFERSVFGIDPDDLEPCDLPPEDEAVGSYMITDEVDDNIDQLRIMVRPDIWEVDSKGVAVLCNKK